MTMALSAVPKSSAAASEKLNLLHHRKWRRRAQNSARPACQDSGKSERREQGGRKMKPTRIHDE